MNSFSGETLRARNNSLKMRGNELIGDVNDRNSNMDYSNFLLFRFKRRIKFFLLKKKNK